MSVAMSKDRTARFALRSDREKKARALVDAVALAGARRWAANEVGAAIAQQLVEPLTALMIYMHELKSSDTVQADGASNPLQGLVDGALRETERVCAIMEKIGNQTAGTVNSELTVGGSDAVTWWVHDEEAAEPAHGQVPGHDTLTPREHEVLNLVSGGVTNKEGAQLLKISPRTFEVHRAQIMRKLGARNVADLLRKVLVEPR
jgi:DNA-binding CsgD family transcriptional regulator